MVVCCTGIVEPRLVEVSKVTVRRIDVPLDVLCTDEDEGIEDEVIDDEDVSEDVRSLSLCELYDSDVDKTVIGVVVGTGDSTKDDESDLPVTPPKLGDMMDPDVDAVDVIPLD